MVLLTDSLISIIIPAHNEENYIRETLHSIKNQSYQNYEVIVVTNGCNDKTEEIMKKRSDDKIRHLTLPIANVSRARNYGAGKAEGSILLFLDADTTLCVDSLKKIKDEFGLKHSIGTTKVKPDINQLKFKVAMWFKNLYNLSGLYKGCSGALICRRDDFDKVNGYDPEIKVKEHRKLTNKLLEMGEYKVVNTSVVTSMRRLKDWGLGKSAYFWIRQFAKDKFGDLKRSEYEKVR